MTVTMTETKQQVDISKLSRSREADWPTVLFFIHINLLSLYAIWILFTEAKLLTILFLITLTLLATLGVTVGAHRLWAHATYKASTELRIALMLFQTLVGQGSIYDWVQHHRLHHAHFKTDGDPYDHRKGFIFAHFLTRLRKLSDYQIALKNSIDMSDLEQDSVVMFQKRFYWVLYGVLFILLPLNAPLEYWDDGILSAIFVIGFLRYCLVLHASWLVESGVALWGLKEGEKYPPDSNIVFLLNRTFWPHYHYIYPRDYKSGEYGSYGSGCSTAFIKIFAAVGLATDLTTLEPHTLQVAMAVAAKTKRPIRECIEEAIKEQVLAEDHFLKKYPPDSNIVFLLNRTFWPHYHYIYPRDYKSGEYGSYGSGCSTAFIKIFAAVGLATDLTTLEPHTLQVAMAVAAKTKRPIRECIEEAIKEQVLAEDHFLKK